MFDRFVQVSDARQVGTEATSPRSRQDLQKAYEHAKAAEKQLEELQQQIALRCVTLEQVREAPP